MKPPFFFSCIFYPFHFLDRYLNKIVLVSPFLETVASLSHSPLPKSRVIGSFSPTTISIEPLLINLHVAAHSRGVTIVLEYATPLKFVPVVWPVIKYTSSQIFHQVSEPPTHSRVLTDSRVITILSGVVILPPVNSTE